MAQHYSDETRAADPHALPDVETFYVTSTNQRFTRGWYWQACFPGCLPDSEPFGPFETEAEALADVGWALLDE